jgi:hypothetical protein
LSYKLQANQFFEAETIIKPRLILWQSLSQNYPNPFNPQTKIDFAVPKSAEVHLAIYNLKGELIRTLLAGQVSPGHYTVLWDGHNQTGEVASSGVYIYKIRIGEWQATKKLTLLK